MTRTRTTLLASAALLAALVLEACGRGGAPTAPPAAPTPPPVVVKTAPVARGDIQQVLSYTGDIKAGSEIQVMAQVSGRVEKLNVDVGSRVNAGDVIAELDKGGLQAALDQAKASLVANRAKLAGMKSGAKPEDVTAAEAAVALAQARLDQASSPARSEQISAAQAQLNQLKVKLAQIRAGAKPEDVAALQATVDQAADAVDQATAGVDQAQKALDNAAATVASAQAQVDNAQAGVVKGQAGLDDARLRQTQAQNGQGGPGVRQQDIDNAQHNVDAAWLAWQNLLNSPTAEQVAVAQAAVKTAQDQQKVSQKQYDSAKKCDAPSGCPDTKVSKAQVDVAKDQVAQAQANLAQVKAGPTDEQKQQAEAQFHALEAIRDKLKSGGTSDAQALQLAVTNADQSLVQNQATLGQMQAVLQQSQTGQQISQAQLTAAQANQAAAQANQAAAQARLESARNPSTFDVQAAQQAVNQAAAQLAQLENPDPFAIQTAQAQLEQAQAQLASVQKPFKAEDLEAQQALVDQSQAALEAAQVNLDEATVRAPVAGVVSQKLVSEGALVGQTTGIVSLLPPGLELDVPVEETNLAAVAPGQSVSVTVAAYPGQQFPGTITTVSPTVDPKSRTVEVKVGLEDPKGLLRPGMFAQLGIVTQAKQGVLLVPRAAVVGRGTEPAVFVVKEGKAVRTPIKLGVANQDAYEVTDGLQEGDQVVVTGQAELNNGDSVVAQAPTS